MSASSNSDGIPKEKKVRLIAYYLPQFHPIPENDMWWGNGFTEWRNVAQARPLFRGHYQPHIPADLGFYDLRVPETRIAQAEMAREHGIEGFCYWHYWFAGKRLLERPFSEVLQSGRPDLPFCLAWANQTWTGVWHNAPDRILIEQTYPGKVDYEDHFYALLNAFSDDRYITIEGKPVFVIYDPRGLPGPKQFTDYWRELALKSGLKGLYLIGIAGRSWTPGKYGFDASVLDSPGVSLASMNRFSRIGRLCRRLTGRDLKWHWKRVRPMPDVYSYRRAISKMLPHLAMDFEQYPSVVPNWDNTPRSGVHGIVFHDSTPELFGIHLAQALKQVARKEPNKRVVFIKSWNEWAEGNHLEPDQRFERAYLEAIKNTVLFAPFSDTPCTERLCLT